MKVILPPRTPPQKRIQESRARFKRARWGRQSGKTTNGGWTMVKKPFEGRTNAVYWHILQTNAAAEVAFNRYVNIYPKESWIYCWAKKPNESERTVFLTGGRQVTFKSGQNYEDLRVETLDGAIIDECRQQNRNLWPMIIRPMLGRHNGWCDFYSTPNGYDWFYDLNKEMESNPNEWGDFHAPSWEAFWWTPQEIESARATMTEPQFAQEIGAEFRNITSSQAYFNFGEHNKVTSNPFCKNGEDWSPHLPICVALDFNVNPMAWTLGQQRIKDFYWGAEIILPNSNTNAAAKVLVDAVKHHKPGIELIGDASGKSRSTRSVAGATDYDIIHSALRQANINFKNTTPESNPLVKDRVNIMNVCLKDGLGEPHMFINTKTCPSLIKDLERVVTVESTGIFALDKSTDKSLTHSSDGVGYYVYQKTGNQFDLRPPTIQVLRR